MILNKTLTLNNGINIPVLGLGTWMMDDATAEEAVCTALKMGYRHIDTAEAYGNEVGVGKGIKKSGIQRNEIFLTTKLHAEAKTYEEAKANIEASLKKLDCGYIDLMIIHAPEPWDSFRDGHHYEEGNLAAWKALSEYYKKGLIKAIGVSNFEIEDIENIINHSDVKPAVNQILTHISNTQFNLIEYCQKHNIVVEAYSPIAHGEMLKNKEVLAIASKYHVSISQLCIQYTLQLGLVSLPKTANPSHMKENSMLDFTISDSDMDILKHLNKIDNYGEYSHFPVFSGKIKE